MQDLASAAGLGIAPSIAPPVIRPTQAIASATELEVSKQRSQGKGKARAPTPPSPLASPNLVLNRQPSLRPQDLLELIVQAETNCSQRSLSPVAGPSSARRSPTPAPAFHLSPVVAPPKRKRGDAATLRAPRHVNSLSYDRKKSLAIAALQANPGEPVQRATSPDDLPITAQELAELGEHRRLVSQGLRFLFSTGSC